MLAIPGSNLSKQGKELIYREIKARKSKLAYGTLVGNGAE